MKFFMDLTTGTNKALKLSVAKKITVPLYAELNTNFALEQCKKDATCMKHIPDHWMKQKLKKDRDYIWTVFSTLQFDFTKQVVNHADSIRQAEPKDPNQREQIMVC